MGCRPTTLESQITNHASQSRQLTLRDGRRIGYCEFGRSGGAPVFYCHGFPGSRIEARVAEDALSRRDVRLIAVDRPGYGLSDFQAGRRIGDWPRDVTVIADALGIRRFAVLGVSGGGAYAAACAARIPDRVTATGIACGLGRADLPELRATMNPFARISFAFAARCPRLAQFSYSTLGRVLRKRPHWILALLARQAPAPDRAVLADPRVQSVLMESYREAYRAGGRGPAYDLTLYARPWDFSPGEIHVPFHVWHGEQDTTVPVAMGRWYEREVPGCRARYLADEGHFSLPVNCMDEILRALVAAGSGNQ